MANSSQFIAAAGRRIDFLTQQDALLAQSAQLYTADAVRIAKVAERTRREIIGYLVPDIDDDELRDMQRKYETTGLMSLKQDAEEKLARAEARRTHLSQLHEVLHAPALVAEVDEKLADIRPTLSALERGTYAMTSSEWFVDLGERGYFSPDYSPWVVGHLRDWRSISFLMTELAEAGHDFDTPTALEEWWLKIQQELDDVRLVVNRLAEERARVTGLADEHVQLKSRPAELLSKLHAALGEHLLEHFEACPEKTLVRLISDDPVLVTFLKKQRGLTRQTSYLAQLAQTRINAQRDSIRTQIGKLKRKVTKARRKSKSYDRRTMASLAELKQDKWAKRHAGLNKLHHRIVGFDDWDSGALSADYLWWDPMTRGANADDIIEVRQFRRAHPHFNYQRYADPLSALDRAADDLASDLRGETVDLLGDIS
ncbi:MAG: hypothetical protein ACI9WU_003727 [Myxococcota bacterium]|jgi:hypothetical protein